MSSFLDESYLGGLGNTDITTAPTVMTEAPQRQVATRNPEMITLPGGITMPKQTFYLLTVIVVAAAVYICTKRKKAD